MKVFGGGDGGFSQDLINMDKFFNKYHSFGEFMKTSPGE